MRARRGWLMIALMMAFVVTRVAPVSGADGEEVRTLKEENAQMRDRINKLEEELSQIRQLLGIRAEEKSVPAAGLTEVEVARLKQLAELKDKPVHSRLDFQLYGFIKLDASYDDSRTSAGNFARWVESEGTIKDDDRFNMTVNQTRLGANVKAAPFAGINTAGRVELDFYGAGTAENKPEPCLRHAFVNLEWPDCRFSVLAGQTSDVISPLVAPTVNYSVAWWQGNIGYRRPQIRLTKEFSLAKNRDVKFEVAPTRTISGRKFIFTGSADPDSGSDSGFPTMQARASLTFPMAGDHRGTVGVSGHWGREEQHKDAFGKNRVLDSWSVNVDARLPVTGWLLFQAEGFVGENLDSYLGGIGQGFDTNLVDAVTSHGGWVAATLTPCAQWQFNVGTGVDDVNNADVSVGGRMSNYAIFGNVYYAVMPNVQLALEIMQMRTTYKAMASGENLRTQLAFIFGF